MASLNGTTLVELRTRCTIPLNNGQPCGHIFRHHPIGGIPIVGETKGKPVADFVIQLMEHVQKAHTKHAQQIFEIGKNFMGFLTLREFETTDAALVGAMNGFAAYLRSLSRLRVTDDEIQTAVAKLGFTMEDPTRVAVIEAMKHMRDYLTELHPQNAGTSPSPS